MLSTHVLLALRVLAVPTPDTVPLYSDLGSHGYAITTSAPLAQRYFDQGLRLYYAFNHAEAVRAFREAQRLDPACAMCFWGEALALGPNINAPMDSAAGVAAYAAAQRALALREKVTEKERALIAAAVTRYAPVPGDDRSALDSAYARALADASRRFPGEAEIDVLRAEALMDLRPWDYWTTEGVPQPGMEAAQAGLERVLAGTPEHPGACHFYIHLMESAQPEKAVACAERLASIMPGAGHLVHMPAHIYIRLGRYVDAIRTNEHAVHADESYIRDQRPGPGTYTAGYYPHNYDFLAFAASMAGRSRQALEAADRMLTLGNADLMRAPGMAFMQHHATRGLQMRIRFERWDEILDAPQPAEDLPHARGMWHYARGRALAARGRIAGAQEELARLRALASDPHLAGLRLEFNTSSAILQVAEHALAAHVAAGRGDRPGAIAHLQEAARREDALTYGEPPEWSIPVREELGAVLLAAGRPVDAERVYREDLRRFPRNGWSLAGLVAALRAERRGVEADAAEAELHAAWEGADVPVPAPRADGR